MAMFMCDGESKINLALRSERENNGGGRRGFKAKSAVHFVPAISLRALSRERECLTGLRKITNERPANHVRQKLPSALPMMDSWRKILNSVNPADYSQ
jgi:hypothetical protein